MQLGKCLLAAVMVLLAGSLITFAIGLIFFTCFGVLPYPLAEILWPSVIIAAVSFILYIAFALFGAKVCAVG